ncbi:MAG: hypothetical protein DWQ02_11450 [Bacteroidetes bacterium]|nr:MAG: hypothetical protein DWQ02_11450 [Bacteroidota bacterium]
MDNMEQIFKSSKNAFDRLEPGIESWDRIRDAVIQDKPSKVFSIYRSSWFRVAAAVLLIAGAVSVWFAIEANNHTKFQNIALESPEGRIVPLDPTQNKYTLVQFWAAGNAICTEQNCYYYLPAYEKYKDHGFEIYAISLDENLNEWVAGIEENDLPWIHVSDLKGWESPVCIECNITKVPSNFLLNHKGKIIARDLEAEELDITLEKLLASSN